MQTATHNRYTPFRYLQCKALAKGSISAAIAHCEGAGALWTDRPQISGVLKAEIGSMGTGDNSALASNPVASAFLGWMRGTSIPLQLMAHMKIVPLNTKLFLAASGAAAGEVAEGQAIPLMRGDWTSTALTPRKFCGLHVLTDELLRSMDATASLAPTAELAAATSEAENYAFISPDVSGSVLNGAPSFSGTGAGLAQIDADLRTLIDLVPGASMPGASFLMTKGSATYLATIRGSGGSAAYPQIGPAGGQLLGLPVLITDAMQQAGSPVTRTIGVLSPSEIFFADGGVQLDVATDAALEQVDTPSGDSLAPTASQLISLYQTNATALRAVRRSAWHARAGGSGAYYVCGF